MTGIRVRQAAVAMMVAIVAACVLAGTAFAASVDVWGTQASISDQDLSGETVAIDTLVISGVPGDTVFLTVKDNDKVVAKNLPHTIGEGDNATVDASDGGSVDAFELIVPSEALESKLASGAYVVSASDTRAGGNPLYSGRVWAVYAHLQHNDKTTTKIIGAVTGATAFNAPAKLYENGVAYKLETASPQTATGSAALEFTYSSYDEATTVDGVVEYVDPSGNTIKTTAIPGIPYDESGDGVTVEIPAAITANNKVYRTLYHADSVTAKNPGQSSFVIPCAPISDAAADAAGHYVALINFVAGDKVIATDSVNVTGTFYYSAPATIYKTENIAGEQRVTTYRIQGKTLYMLEPSTDPAVVDPTTRQRVVNIPYEADELEPAQVTVTFNLIDGQKRTNAGDARRLLGTQTETVDAQNPTATPKTQITVDGTKYNLAGDANAYAYTYGSGDVPVVNVYYVPDGYQAPGPYTVTVNYVNFRTDQVVSSETFESSPDDLADMRLETPEEFMESGVTYVRLAGQEAPIAHNYWSNNTVYTVYYRDINDTLSAGTVITHVRVVYDDVVTTRTTTTTTTGGTTGTGGTAGTPAVGYTPAGSATNPGQLNTTGNYNVFDGTGNRGMTNERGTDTNTERISDDETPLAQNADGSPAQSQDNGMVVATVIALIVAAIGLLIWFLLARRRKQEDEQQQGLQ